MLRKRKALLMTLMIFFITSSTLGLDDGTTTMTTLLAYEQPPNYAAAPPLKINFTVGFNKTWSADLLDRTSSAYIVFKAEVERGLDFAFTGCPGYYALSAVVTGFYYQTTNLTVASLIRPEGAAYPKVTNLLDIVFASYGSSFDSKVIIEKGDEAVKYIAEQTTEKLKTTVFGASVSVVPSSLEGMAAAAAVPVSGLRSDPCRLIGTYVCSTCYPCKSSSQTTALTCSAVCRDPLKVCTVAGDNTAGCTCKSRYLPVGSGCVNESVIIGAAAGVVGAVLLALVIALVIQSCKPDNKVKERDTINPRDLANTDDDPALRKTERTASHQDNRV